MNQQTPYETLIAEKITALPLPDMADPIWARIEAQLDAPPGNDPQDEGPGNKPQPPQPPRKPRPARLKWLLPAAGAAVALMIVLFTSRPKRQHNTPQQTMPPVPAITDTLRQAPVIVSDTLPATGQVPPAAPYIQKESTGKGDDTELKTVPVNNLVPATAFTNTVTDTALPPPPVAQPFAAMADTGSKPKNNKPRGVTGIQDADYKIVPQKKDSLKQQ